MLPTLASPVPPPYPPHSPFVLSRPTPMFGGGLEKCTELLGTSYGPLPGEKLILTAAGKAIFTCSGPSLLTSFTSDDAIQGLVMRAAQAQASHSGDGSKTFIIMVAAALAEIERQLGAVPGARRRSCLAMLARSASWVAHEVLPKVLVPRLRAQYRYGGLESSCARLGPYEPIESRITWQSKSDCEYTCGSTPHRCGKSGRDSVWRPPRSHGIGSPIGGARRYAAAVVATGASLRCAAARSLPWRLALTLGVWRVARGKWRERVARAVKRKACGLRSVCPCSMPCGI